MRGRRFVEREPNPERIPAPRRVLYCVLFALAALGAGAGWAWLLLHPPGGNVAAALTWLLPVASVWFAVLSVRSPGLSVTVTPGAVLVRKLLQTRRVPLSAIVGVDEASYDGMLYVDSWPEFLQPSASWQVPVLRVRGGYDVDLAHLAGRPRGTDVRLKQLRVALARVGWTAPATPIVWKLESDRRDPP